MDNSPTDKMTKCWLLQKGDDSARQNTIIPVTMGSWDHGSHSFTPMFHSFPEKNPSCKIGPIHGEIPLFQSVNSQISGDIGDIPGGVTDRPWAAWLGFPAGSMFCPGSEPSPQVAKAGRAPRRGKKWGTSPWKNRGLWWFNAFKYEKPWVI